MKHLNAIIALAALNGIFGTLLFRYVLDVSGPVSEYPVLTVIIFGGSILVARLIHGMWKGNFGSDLLAGLSIVTALLLGEYLAGAIVVLMLSGGTALEDFAMRRASSVLDALAKRMPQIAHRRTAQQLQEIPAGEVEIGDEVVVLPHELCPVDGVVIEGRSSMDESYLTGEPYKLSKTPGCEVISGAINGEGVVVIRASRKAIDSRYIKIMKVMDVTRQRRPRMRRLADRLGALYTPLAVLIAIAAWYGSQDPTRFLAVLVVATPCPLIIAIPVAIIGAISWCARRGIIIKDPIVLERGYSCDVLITDKTGTLTVGEPELVSIEGCGVTEEEVLRLAAGLEQYSKHPLAQPVLDAAKARGLVVPEAFEVSEQPGRGLSGRVGTHLVAITGRKEMAAEVVGRFGTSTSGLECIVVIDGEARGLLRFRDEPRPESRSFVAHLAPQHGFREVILLSGDRDTEVQYLASQIGIARVFSGKSPEEKVEIVREESSKSRTLYLGDGINDAPALTAASVGIAFGPRSEITSEAAGAVILEPSLRKVDQFLHISRHMRRVALESAVGGMTLSVVGMIFASFGLLSPVAGAVVQEGIDLFAVVNALRAARLGDHNSEDMG
jgi:heavy metal translocating P-type ATPase